MSWRVAKSLETLRAQVNHMYPGRSKSSDGTIGDTSHQATKSEHNPDKNGVVRALDITHDPAHGVDTYKMSEGLRLKRDKRILYVISNGRIFSSQVQPWVWRKYTGANKHDHHNHISVVENPAVYDLTTPWDLSAGASAPAGASYPPATPVAAVRPLLTRGSTLAADVRKLQTMLGATGKDVDGIFGPKTEAAVRGFQEHAGILVDGKVGPYTWEALDKIAKK